MLCFEALNLDRCLSNLSPIYASTAFTTALQIMFYNPDKGWVPTLETKIVMLDNNTLSVLENALDREFYEIKKPSLPTKPPIRVLVTEAGYKLAHHLVYKICSGVVFGPDQEVILHLGNSRGSLHHRDVAVELFECGFPCYKDYVVSSNPSIIYKNIDFAVLVTTYEEIAGWGIRAAFTYQILKARQVARYLEEYSKPDCKVVLTGPSTKAVVSFLSTLRQFLRKIPDCNISCVTCLDVFISKAILAAKLKTTTDKIKNVIIWSCTYPDVKLATVHTTPRDDLGPAKFIDTPVRSLLDDEDWLIKTFNRSIFRRIMTRDLLLWGKSIAAATAHHLKVLYKGTDNFDEIQSMGMITPPDEAYTLPPGIGFSFPVIVKDGKVDVLRDISCDVTTFLNRLRLIYSIKQSYLYNSAIKIYFFLSDYEDAKKLMNSHSKDKTEQGWESKTYINKYFITPSPAEGVTVLRKDPNCSNKKGIAWGTGPKKVMKHNQVSFSKINFEESKKEDSDQEK